MTTPLPTSFDHGFTLVEVLIAALLLTSVAMAGAWAMATAATTLGRSRDETIATTAAAARLEQLRGLEWGRGDAAAPVSVSDLQTDLSGPTRSAGGSGLGVSSASTLLANQPGYVDYLDRDGRWVGNGLAAPPAARFTRRWGVSAVTGSTDLRLIQVFVMRPPAAGAVRPGDAVWLVAAKGRKAF